MNLGAIVDEWFERSISAYPQLTADFLRSEPDPFRNPLGSRLREGLHSLAAEIEGEMDRSRLETALDDILRVRAVQEIPPSQAVGFVLLLRDLLDEAGEEHPARMHKRVEQLLLMAFDHYLLCREDLARVRDSEAQRAHGVRDRQRARGRA